MKAAIYYSPENMKVEETDYPECPDGGVILKVHAVGICGSDIRTYYNGSNKVDPPSIIGHELAGEIIEIGKSHKFYKIGDSLAGAPGLYCNRCFYCEHDMRTVCENMAELGQKYPGAFAEYIPIPGEFFERGRLVSIPEGLSYEDAAVCEPCTSVLYSQERANINAEDTVVIIGAGPIGCIQIEVAKIRGVKKIILIEIAKERLEAARIFEADHYIDASETDPIKEVKNLTGGLGADKIIVAAPSSIAQAQSIEMARKRGIVVFFGGLPKDNPFAKIDANIIHYNDIIVMGHYGQERRHSRQALQYIKEGKIDSKKIISKILPLDDIIEGIEMMKSKSVLKVIIKP